jgi:hypothetical protein
MTRQALAGLAVGATALAIGIAGCGSSTGKSASSRPGSSSSSRTGSATTSSGSTAGGPPRSAVRLSVSPTVGKPSSVLRFSFTAPASTGQEGHDLVSYTLSVRGRPHPGCVGIHGATLPAVRVGQMVTTSLGPAQLGGSWCPGTFSARVEELESAACAAGQMCPQFIRIVVVIGPVSFKISG